MWKILRPFFTILVFSLSVQNVSFCQQSDPCEGKLPEQVQAEVQTKFGGWRIETKEDLSDDHKQMWGKTHSGECPGLASGHFRSPRDLSFAILVISKDPKIVGYRLLVADPGSQNGYHVRLLQRYDQPISGDVVVYRTAPGKYFQPEKAGDVTADLDGIVLESMESGAFLFHWKNGRYVRSLISE